MGNGILSLLFNLEQEFSDGGLALPDVKVRLFKWLIFTKMLQKKFFQEDRKFQTELDELILQFASYMVILAYDDPVDEGLLDKAQVYDQLSRCLASFAIGAFLGFPCTMEALTRGFAEFQSLVQRSLGNHTFVLTDIQSLLVSSRFLTASSPHQCFTEIAELYYGERESEISRELNVTIRAAYRLGQIYGEMKEKLAGTPLDPKGSAWHKDFMIESLLKSGYAQANTTRQLRIDDISLGEYIPIATWKSNAFIDLVGCLRSMLNLNEFQSLRFHDARFCEQIIDDIMDFSEDCEGGVLDFFQLRLLEQGRLAQSLLQMGEPNLYAPGFIDLIRDKVESSGLLVEYFDHCFIFKNPFISAAGNVNQRPVHEKSNIESIIREALTNSQDELKMDLKSLLILRSKYSSDFTKAWRAGEFGKCRQTLIRSSIPSLTTRSLLTFIQRHRSSIITNEPQRIKYIYYYIFLILFLKFSILKFSASRVIINLLERSKRSRRSTKVTYEKAS